MEINTIINCDYYNKCLKSAVIREAIQKNVNRWYID